MASDGKTARFYGCLLSFALWVPGAYSATGTIPDEQLDRLVRSDFVGSVKMSGWLLGIDGAKILNASAGAEHTAESRAKAFATQRLLAYSMRNVRWPPGLGSEVVAGISNSFLRSYLIKTPLQGLQSVKLWKTGEASIRIIVSLPEPEKQIPAVSIDDVKAGLRSTLTRDPEKIDLAAYLEFCDKSELPSVVDLLGERVAHHGTGAVATFIGSRLRSSASFRIETGRRVDTLMPTSRTEGLELLRFRPYDPAVCLALGNLMQKSGYPRTAQLLFSRGASVFVRREEAAACQIKAAQDLWPLSFSAPKPELPQGVILRSWKASGVGMEEISPASRLIVESAGRLPVQAVTTSDKNYEQAWKEFAAAPSNLTNALRFAMESLEVEVTADAANLVGRVFMLQNRNGAAIPFLEQARFLDPGHPYAEANLALALHGIGEKSMAEPIARHAANSPTTPAKLKDKLAGLFNFSLVK